MPVSDTPVADLGSQLLALLMHTLLWVLCGSVLLAGAVWWLARRRPALVARWRATLFGGREPLSPEPGGRRFLRIAFGLLWVGDGLLQAQPLMPSGFVARTLAMGNGPSWFVSAQELLARAWIRHPVAADVATVWVQIGLGLLILLGGRGLLARLALWGSIVWSAAVWVLGESVGGLLAAGAGWLTGAPGAVLVYAIAAGVLLAPWSWWADGRAAVLLRRSGAVWFLVAAALSALPGEGFWTATGLSAPFGEGAATNPSALLRAPITRLSRLATDSPHVLNLVVVAVLVALALGLWIRGNAGVLAAAIVWCLLTWWLAQDFGVLGGTGTDPNTALPLALLISSALPVWQAEPAEAASDRPAQPDASAVRSAGWWLGAGAGACTLAIGLMLVVPAAIAGLLFAPADASAVAADSNGGLRAIPARPAPSFRLTDQRGHAVSNATLRGKLVALTFLDPVCTSDCPLIANQLADADRRIGGLARQVEFVAIDTNPIFHRQEDVAAFTGAHGLGRLPNWHFLCGPARRVEDVLTRYGISVGVPAVGMIEHSEAIYFIRPDGREAGYLDDGASRELTATYASQVAAEIRSLLR